MNKVEFENKDNEIARLWEHKKVDAQTIQAQSDLIELLEKALELACEALNKNIENLCEFCYYQGTNENHGSCECDEQFETERTMDYFKTKAKEMMKSE